MGKIHCRLINEIAQNDQSINFAGVYDSDPAVTEIISKQYSIKAYRSLDEILAEVDALVARAKKALVEFENLDQKQVDRIVAKASIAALNKHLVLAKMAVDETGRGLVEDKATKNIFACEHVTNYLAGQKTVGIIREDSLDGRLEFKAQCMSGDNLIVRSIRVLQAE